MAAAACAIRGGGYVLLHVEQPWRGAMKPRKWSGSLSAGTAEFPGIVEDESQGGFGHQTDEWQAASPSEVESAQTRRLGCW